MCGSSGSKTLDRISPFLNNRSVCFDNISRMLAAVIMLAALITCATGNGQDDPPTGPGCEQPKDGIYTTCTMVCGDQVSALSEGQPCFLPKSEAPRLPVERGAAEGARLTGVCENGQCVSKDTSQAKVQASD
nr:uncharacterized protein LOC126545003 [Dermacentor andersoni]